MIKKFLLLLIVLCIPLSSAVLNDGLVRAFTFDNQYSNATYTISPVGDGNGTVVGAALNGTGCLIAQCYTYTGTNYISLGNSPQLVQPQNFSVSLWINRSSSNSGMYVAGRATLADRDWWMWLGNGDSNPGDKAEGVAKLNGANYALIGNTSGAAPQSRWIHLVINVNETHASFWVNGTHIRAVAIGSGLGVGAANTFIARDLFAGLNWTGQIDEFYVWNRALTALDIDQLYNDGSGSQYPFTDSGSITTSLISPPSGTSLSDVGSNFTASYTVTNVNLSNATYSVWFSNGTLFNRTTVTVLGNTTNTTTVFIDDFTINNYIWNVLACGVNVTGAAVCDEADSNNTFSVSFSFSNTTFNAIVYETDNQTFNLSIGIFPSVISVSGHLIYNGSRYLAQSNCTGSVCQISTQIDIPLVNTSTSELKLFFWNITQFDGSTSSTGQTTTETQNVTRIFLDICGGAATTLALNFTAWDEQNRTRINPFRFAGTFNFWLGHGSVFRNQSFNNASIIERTICINPSNRTFKIDADIEYDEANNGTLYNQRNYYFRNGSITNNTQHIKLFLLLSTASTSFIQKVITTSQIAVEDALIFVQRYYPGDNSYETVSVSRTDGNGESIGFYEIEIPEYRHLITKDGQLLKTTDKGKIFPESAPFTLTFTIGEEFSTPWEPFLGIPNVVSSLEFNETTEIVTYTWIDTTGTLSVANLTVEKVYSSRPNEVICSQSSILQAGTLTCNVSGQEGTLNARGFIGRSPSVLDKLISFTINELKVLLAQQFLIPWILILIATIAMSLFFPPAGVPLLIGVLALGNILGIVAVGWVFVWAIVAVGIWVLVETTT